MKDYYTPALATIEKISNLTPDIRLFTLKIVDRDLRKKFEFLPGQFVFISVFGFGEAPISIASSPKDKDFLEISVRKVGLVTKALFELRDGDKVGVRGPFGNGFNVGNFSKKNLIFVTGGCGIPPLRSFIRYIIEKRKNFGEVVLLYGAKTPEDILFKKELESFKKFIKVLLTVDKKTKDWMGCTGVVTDLFKYVDIPQKDTKALLCGPPIMYKFVVEELISKGIDEKDIYLSLERRMRCGIGKCQHCTCGDKYVCLDGPVFRYDEIKDNWEAVV